MPSLVNVTVAVVTPSLNAKNRSAKSLVARAGTCRGREHRNKMRKKLTAYTRAPKPDDHERCSPATREASCRTITLVFLKMAYVEQISTAFFFGLQRTTTFTAFLIIHHVYLSDIQFFICIYSEQGKPRTKIPLTKNRVSIDKRYRLHDLRFSSRSASY